MIRWRRNIAIVLIAVLSLWFNVDTRLLASGFSPASYAHGGEVHGLAATDHGHGPAHSGHGHGRAPAGDDQGDTRLDHSICSAHCVPTIMAIAAQAPSPQRFDRIAIPRLPGPPGRRADPPLIPPEYRS